MTEPIDINSALKILNLKPGVSQEETKQLTESSLLSVILTVF